MTAVWTTPKTWTAGELVTALDMNKYLRDNVDYLKARPLGAVSNLTGSVGNTTSTTYIDVPGASVSITMSGTSRILVVGNITWGLSASATAYLQVEVDGVALGHVNNGVRWKQNLINGFDGSDFVCVPNFTISDGTHTVKMRYRTSGNTLTAYGFYMVVMEVL